MWLLAFIVALYSVYFTWLIHGRITDRREERKWRSGQ
jgi:hypothetical protein